MKKYIYTLLSAIILVGSMTRCNDDDSKNINYLDDNAYPPPVVTITSASTLPEAMFKGEITVTGNASSGIGLRDIYATLMKKEGDEYVEISKNNRVTFALDELPETTGFSIKIPITDEETEAIGVYATDVITKSSLENVIIEVLKGVPPKITLNPSEIESVEFNGTVSVNGTATSKVGLKSISYVLVRKSPYLELQAAQNINFTPGINEKEFSFEITVDNENADAIRVESEDTDGYSYVSYVDIKSIEGIPPGRAYIFENVEMAPEWEIPSTTGIIPTQPYLFSIDGIQVGNELKNIVTLKEALDASSGSIDFAFVNIWRNSSFVAVANRGFAYISAARLSGGPVGRQVDTDWLGGITKNAVGFNIITDEVAGAMQLDHFFETTTGNWETFEALSALDSYVTASMVNNDANRVLKQRTNAGASGSCNMEITSGTYIAFRRVVNGSEDKFGIIKVIEAADDTDATSDGCKIADTVTGSTTPGASAYYTGPNLPGFVYDGVTKLYGRTCKLKIIVQQ